MTPRHSTTLWGALVAWLGTVAAVAGVGQAPQDPVPKPTRGPVADLSMFAPSSECVACHNNLTAPSGEDVSIGASWRGSMMANAARDPYFLASVRREVLDHPLRAADIEDECAACHLPAAQKIARQGGGLGRVLPFGPDAPGSGSPDLDQLARDGVTCSVCHQIAGDGLGTRGRFNGNFAVAAPLPDGSRRALGPYAPDVARARVMHSVTRYEQTLAPHIRESEFCATCHTLVTEAFGPDGRVIGSLPEQMNYQEWRHSVFDEERRGCQSCHMPLVQGPVRVASVLGLDRPTLSRHAFLGGNAFMLRLMNRYRAELGVEATSAELEATARATIRQLEQETATLQIRRAWVDAGVLALDVAVTNLTGHKLPTGYPSRRVWLHVVARDATGRTLYESGAADADGRIAGNAGDDDAAAFEPHFAQITRPGEVQIYESVMGTPAGVPTTGLLQATRYLKDNRLLPRGFDKRTAAPEIAVVGAAASDDDFAGGGDVVRYRVPVSAVPAVVSVTLNYQSIGYRWAHNLGPYPAPEPQRFLRYFKSVAASSVITVARASADVAVGGTR